MFKAGGGPRPYTQHRRLARGVAFYPRAQKFFLSEKVCGHILTIDYCGHMQNSRLAGTLEAYSKIRDQNRHKRRSSRRLPSACFQCPRKILTVGRLSIARSALSSRNVQLRSNRNAGIVADEGENLYSHLRRLITGAIAMGTHPPPII